MSTFLRGKHAFLLTLVVAAISVGSLAADDKPAVAKHLLKVSIKGSVAEQGGSMSLFGPPAGASLRELCDSIRKAAKDEKVGALMLDLGNAAVGTAQGQALRRALIGFRKSGKKSYCHLATGGTGSYLLASACSEVSLHPAGGLELTGPGAQFMHFHGLLKKVGVTFQELRTALEQRIRCVRPFAVPEVFMISFSCGSRNPRNTNRAFTTLEVVPSGLSPSFHCNTQRLDIGFRREADFLIAEQASCFTQEVSSFFIASRHCLVVETTSNRASLSSWKSLL